MSEVNIFEQATRIGLRFGSPRGTLLVDDLWTIPLEEVDILAIAFKRQIADTGEIDSFITQKSVVDPKIVLGLEICKHIIEVRLDEKETAEKAVLNKQMKDRIAQIILEKQDGELQEKSLEELQEMAASL